MRRDTGRRSNAHIHPPPRSHGHSRHARRTSTKLVAQGRRVTEPRARALGGNRDFAHDCPSARKIEHRPCLSTNVRVASAALNAQLRAVCCGCGVCKKTRGETQNGRGRSRPVFGTQRHHRCRWRWSQSRNRATMASGRRCHVADLRECGRSIHGAPDAGGAEESARTALLHGASDHDALNSPVSRALPSWPEYDKSHTRMPPPIQLLSEGDVDELLARLRRERVHRWVLGEEPLVVAAAALSAPPSPLPHVPSPRTACRALLALGTLTWGCCLRRVNWSLCLVARWYRQWRRRRSGYTAVPGSPCGDGDRDVSPLASGTFPV